MFGSAQKFLCILALASAYHCALHHCAPLDGEAYEAFAALPDSDLSQEAYSAIGNYLAKQVKSEDTSENIGLVVELLAEEEKRSDSRPLILEALKKLAALKEIEGDNKCSRKSYETLVANDKSTYGAIFKELSNRAFVILRKYAKQFADDCTKTFQAQSSSKLSQMDREIVRAASTGVSLNTKLVVCPGSEGFTPFHLRDHKNAYVIDGNEPDNEDEDEDSPGEANFHTLTYMSLSKKDPEAKNILNPTVKDPETGKMIVDRKLVARLFEDYLVQPCKEYMNQMADVALPAIFGEDLTENGYGSNEATVMFRMCDNQFNYDYDRVINAIVDYGSR